MHKYIRVVLGFTAALALAGGGLAAEKTTNLSRSTMSGMNTTIAYSGRWDKNCNSVPVTITITRQPANGAVSVVDADEVLPDSTPGSGDTGHCAGKVIKSKMIMYQSKSGFSGDDIIGYDSDGNGTVIHTTIKISVQ